MTDLPTYIQNSLSLLEGYVFASDKSQYLQEKVTLSQDKRFFDLLLNPIDTTQIKERQLMRALRLPEQIQTEHLTAKIMRELTQASTVQQKQRAIKNIKQIFQSTFQFDYPKPIEFTGEQVLLNSDNKERKVQSKFETENTVKQVVMKILKENPQNLGKLSNYGLKNLPLSELNSLDQNLIGIIFSKIEILKALDAVQVAQLLTKIITKTAQAKNTEPFQEFPNQFYTTLTVEQIQELKKRMPKLFQSPSYFAGQFRQKYQERLSIFKPLNELSLSEIEKKRKECQIILQQLKSQNNQFNFFQMEKLVEEILLIDSILSNSNEQFFKKYLKNLKSRTFQHFSKNFKLQVRQQHGKLRYWNQGHDQLTYLDSTRLGQSEIIKRTITSLFKANISTTLESLSQFISRSYLTKEEAKVKLSMGLQKDVSNIHQIFTVDELNQIKQKKEITLMDKNKNVFTINEKVQLKLKVKNIKNINVKIYQFDLQKQYLQKGEQINQEINLKFLKPCRQFSNPISTKDSFEQIQISIPIKQLDDKLGMFIVEFQGDTISSRAVIRKGTILHQNKITMTGHQITFYDQQGKPIQQLTLWRQNKQIQVKDTYKIPFGPQGTQKLIAAYNGYAEFIYINVKPETYSFNIDYIYHSQSFIVGNKAKIILRPSLKLSDATYGVFVGGSGNNISLSRLRNVVIKIATMNNLNIASTQILDNVQFKDNEDFVVQTPIKSYIKNFGIIVEGEIELINKEVQKINNSKVINIDLQENTNNFVDLYLQKNDTGEYTLKVKGKNGQSISYAETAISYEQFGADFSFSQQLTTNENGQVSLGKLLQVKKMTINVTSGGYASLRTWKINDYSQNVSYGGNIFTDSYKIYLKEGDSVVLPLPCEMQTNNDIIFYSSNIHTDATHNLISSIKLTKERLQTDKLKAGKYTLILLRLDRRIDLVVVKGKDWIGDKLIDQNNLIYNVKNKTQNFISLGDISAQVKENQVQYSISIISEKQNLPEDARVHIFAKNYIDPENNQFFNCSKCIECPPNDITSLTLKNSTYFNNKRLSDQTAYVLNRKNQSIISGNNLQKPHIFLKRMEVRSTEVKEEELVKESMYDMAPRMMYCGAPPSRNCQKACLKSCMNMDDMLFGASNQSRHLRMTSTVTLQRSLNTHNNFLQRVGHLNSNLKTIQSVKVPLGYNQIVVYLITNNTTIKREYSLPQSQLQQLKMTHPILDDVDKKTGWTMSREIYPILQGDRKQISRNSTWTTVSIANVVDYAKARGNAIPDWILGWNSYTEQKKLQIYDKEVCHELNFFIYKKDKSFFQNVIKPFISNKISKTFIDLYLLDSPEILEYGQSHRLEKLNYFEKALLTEKLKHFGKQKEAVQLANSLQLPLKNIKQSNQEFKRFFETVLNSKRQSPNAPSMMSGGFGGAAPGSLLMGYPQSRQQQQYYSRNQCCMMECASYEPSCDMAAKFEQAKDQYKPGFKQTEKTKEYTETTYSSVIDATTTANIFPASLFWAELALHYSSAKSGLDFLSYKFCSLNLKIEFILACAVLPSNPQAQFQLVNCQNNYQITAKSSFLVFVREVKSLAYEQSKSIVLNQRFFDPQNRYYYDDEGVQIQKQIDSFLVKKSYCVQTIITNISGSNLQIQLLMDIPQGSIPLKSHQQTQIISLTLTAYSTKTFEREFYFPEEGSYSHYPANASRGKTIVAKAVKPEKLTVGKTVVSSKEQSLNNILRTGSDEDIYNYLSTRNIFDSNIFDIGLILWKLKNKQFYRHCIQIFRERHYYNPLVWSFSFYHQDFNEIKQFIQNRNTGLLGLPSLELPIFEYYPYYSSRAHKFLDENKSTIRVKQFKENYAKFLYSSVFQGKIQDSVIQLTLIYYLLLQDRIAEAKQIYAKVKSTDKKTFKIQYDYIDCFIDMYSGANSSYEIAKTVSQRYLDYPVLSWRKLFKNVYDAFANNCEQLSEQSTKGEEQVFSTTIVRNGNEIKINRPAQTKVVVNFYQIDLQLYFSEYPFEDVSTFSAIIPTETVQFEGPQFKVQKLDRKNYQHLKDMIVEIYQYRPNIAVNKISSFLWTNPDIKVKINETEGTLKIFQNNKKSPTSYCKVYSRGVKGNKFYRDGYTDIAATFRYALDVQDISQFSILVLTDNGGSIHKVRPPIVE